MVLLFGCRSINHEMKGLNLVTEEFWCNDNHYNKCILCYSKFKK